MSLEYLEHADIAFMREPNSIGVYRIIKKPRAHMNFNRISLVDVDTFNECMKDPGYRVCWYSVNMKFMEANFSLPSEDGGDPEHHAMLCANGFHEYEPKKLLNGFLLRECAGCGKRVCNSVHASSMHPSQPLSQPLSLWLAGIMDYTKEDEAIANIKQEEYTKQGGILI